MKVKIGDVLYDSEHQPIMIILTPLERDQVSHMSKNATKYCSAPYGMSEEDMGKFMTEPTHPGDPS